MTKDTMDTLRMEVCSLQRMIEEKDWIIEMQMQTKEISQTKANQLIAEVGKLREELRIIKYKNVPLRAQYWPDDDDDKRETSSTVNGQNTISVYDRQMTQDAGLTEQEDVSNYDNIPFSKASIRTEISDF